LYFFTFPEYFTSQRKHPPSAELPNLLSLAGNGDRYSAGQYFDGATPAMLTTSLQKFGSGTWTISSAGHNYTGSTTVAEGVFDVSPSASIDTSPVISVTAADSLLTNHIRATMRTLDSAATIRADGGALGASNVETLVMNAGGKLNLAKNDLVIGTGHWSRFAIKSSSTRLASRIRQPRPASPAT
jgi:autotransporter-associated beta strand protein